MAHSCSYSSTTWETPAHCYVWLPAWNAALTLLGHSYYVLIPEKWFIQDFTWVMLVSYQFVLFFQHQLTSTTYFSEAKVLLQWTWSLVNHSWFFIHDWTENTNSYFKMSHKYLWYYFFFPLKCNKSGIHHLHSSQHSYLTSTNIIAH